MEEIIIILVCLALNALVACFEMALVSVSKSDLRRLVKQGNRDAQLVLQMREHPERALSILQILITLVGALSAAVGGVGAKESLAPFFASYFGVSENVADFVAVLCVVVPITYASVVVGELVPKAVALRYPTQVTILGAHWVLIGGRILSPFVNLLTWSTKLILNLIIPSHKSKPTAAGEGEDVSIERLSQQHQQYVLNLVAIEQKRVKDIVVPWSEVQSVRLDQNNDEITNEVYRSGHTRLPVMEGQDIVGILHTKEYLAYISSGETNWRSIIRPILRISDQQDLLKTLLQMQERRSHMGIVFNRREEILGIVTLEDIIEEVVGEFYDEYDDGRIQKILAAKPKFRFIMPNKKN